ncbi:Rrf2 family transcriptional regulator [Ktedonosporobacter rubrisoli]|uniref:Rrf2 family transcriptional regulator n=1 Tax=Ktedonosporobacter rubrisoli TaxID=2509675 RepID=A0A4V0YY77_KTERU|nr:Rrf2 family transcriptional regulator [Ktedonosporobacter rubrisoli]QBD75261.1 Rrf2 family transcriptional regulator [Ktedonosporobacter rubrisoli]
MKLSEGVEWGLHCVCLLAELPAGATLPTKALAEYHGLSETYLSKHLQALTNERILESVPGPKGGYRLTRSAEEITLLEVVEAIDGHEPLFRCTEIRQQGPLALPCEQYRLPCAVHVAMAQADKAWRNTLRMQSIADVVKKYAGNAEPQQRQRLEQWISKRVRHSSPKR